MCAWGRRAVYGVSPAATRRHFNNQLCSKKSPSVCVCVLQEKILRPLWQVLSVLRMTSMCIENYHMIMKRGVSDKGLIMEGFITLASVVLV